MNRAALPCALATLFIAGAALATEAPADLVIKGGSVWSVDPASSRAEAVAVSDGRISFVGSVRDAEALVEEGRTRVIQVPADALVLPGFIDNHVHFARAGSLLLGLNLLEVNDAEGFRHAVREAAARLPEAAWVTGGEWGRLRRVDQELHGSGIERGHRSGLRTRQGAGRRRYRWPARIHSPLRSHDVPREHSRARSGRDRCRHARSHGRRDRPGRIG